MPPSALRSQIEQSLSPKFESTFSCKEKRSPVLLPSGIRHLDVPRGTLTEIYGSASSGKTGLVCAALAHATRLPEYCVLIDASDSFDPASGSEAGIKLNQLLWIRCGGNAEHALKAADLVIQAGGFGLVVLDLDGVPARDARRISLASWFRLRHTAEKTNTALVVVEQELNAGSCSTLQIETRREGVRFHGALLRGIEGEAKFGPRLRVETQYKLDPVFRT
jgi:recombination protein RecA